MADPRKRGANELDEAFAKMKVALLREGFEAGYHCTWTVSGGYSFAPEYKPGDPKGAFQAFLTQREQEPK